MASELLRIYSQREKFGPSGHYDVNFYFESDRLGVSDNHRMAYPFFLRQGGNGITLVHLDTHNDCSYFLAEAQAPDYCSDFLAETQKALAQVDATCDVDAFLQFRCPSDKNSDEMEHPVHCGNWITAFFRMHPHAFARGYIISYDGPLGTTRIELPTVKTAKESAFWSAASKHSSSTYYSIDIDYYFDWVDKERTYTLRPEIGDPYGHFRECLQHALADTRSAVFLALSPGCCGGWQNTIPFLRIIDQVAGTSLVNQLQKHLP